MENFSDLNKDSPRFIEVTECGKKVVYEQLEINFKAKKRGAQHGKTTRNSQIGLGR